MSVHYLPVEPKDWRADALCAEIGGDLFFPDQGESPKPAKRICAACPVRAECLAFHLSLSSTADQFGIAGGMSQRERRRARQAAA